MRRSPAGQSFQDIGANAYPLYTKKEPQAVKQERRRRVTNVIYGMLCRYISLKRRDLVFGAVYSVRYIYIAPVYLQA